MPASVDAAFSLSAEEAAALLRVERTAGLSGDEVSERLVVFGRNVLAEQQRTSLWSMLVAQFNNIVIYLLFGAAAAAFLFDEVVEGAAVLVVIVINAVIGFFMEYQAVRSMDALRKLSQVRARVRRNGHAQEVPADELVPGDVLLVEAGDVVAADARVLRDVQLEVDESTLTGESVPVAKHSAALADDTPLAEQSNMLFRGTAVTRGNAEAVVVHTGMNTELGAIAALVQTAKQEATPLEEKLNVFGKRLVWLTLVLAVAIIVVGVLRGDDLVLVVETAIALSVAAIPEGMPIVATIALARGMMRMAQRNVIVRRLASVETLGGTNVICTDKTGTLTENRLTVALLSCASGSVEVVWNANGSLSFVGADIGGVLPRLVDAMVLCNNASYVPGSDTGTGDPLEVALLRFAEAVDSASVQGLQQWRRVQEEPFDSDTKIMATLYQCAEQRRVAVKGAPEVVLRRCASVLNSAAQPLSASEQQAWLDLADTLSADGLRVLAFADSFDVDEVSAEGLVFIGLVGFLDPPRFDVAPALRECAEAGIRVVMVTGDHPATAQAIAARVQLADDADVAPAVRGEVLDNAAMLQSEAKSELLRSRVFARVTPRQKLELISLYQSNGDVVAMTGDGVNDAPALRKADIGIAMGKRGTQIAREAATMVLEDDSFASIVEAVRQGRVIFDNIRRFVIYLLSCNISEIFVVAGATVVGLPLPLLPLQILFLNLVTDVFPALALGVGTGDRGIMKQRPRHPGEPIVSRQLWVAILVYGAAMTLSGIAVVWYCDEWLKLDAVVANNVAFLSLTLAQLLHVFNMAPARYSLLRNDVVRNRYVWMALGLCLGILAAAFLIVPVRTALSLTTEVLDYWYIVCAGSLMPAVVNQFLKRVGVVW